MINFSVSSFIGSDDKFRYEVSGSTRGWMITKWAVDGPRIPPRMSVVSIVNDDYTWVGVLTDHDPFFFSSASQAFAFLGVPNPLI